MGQATTTTSAFLFNNTYFRCQQPTAELSVDDQWVRLVVTTYQSTFDDSVNTTQFPFVTFNDKVAHGKFSLWDPTYRNPAVADAFGPFAATPQGIDAQMVYQDPLAWRGLCNEKGRAEPFNTTMVVQPHPVQFAGCDCPVYQLDQSGMPTLLASADALSNRWVCNDTATPGARIFRTAAGAPTNTTATYLSNYWTVRQTRCDAASGDHCDTRGSFVPSGNSDAQSCGLKTEAMFLLPFGKFFQVMTSAPGEKTFPDSSKINYLRTIDSDGLTQRYAFDVYAVEYAPSAAAQLGAATYQRRVTPFHFSFSVFKTGAIVERISSDSTAPPMFVHASALSDYGAVASRTRDDSGARSTLTLTWSMNAYVIQSTRTNDTVLTMTAMNGTVLAPSIAFANAMGARRRLLAGGFSAVCSPFARSTPGVPITIRQSSYACADTQCAPVNQTTLPASVLSGLLNSFRAQPRLWRQYYISVTCTIIHPQKLAPTAAFVVPPLSINIPFALMNSTSGAYLTDQSSTTIATVQQSAFTSSGVPAAASVSFPLQSSVIQLDEVSIQTATSLTNLVELNANNVPVNLAGAAIPIQYSQGLALRVQLVDADARNYYQVRGAEPP